MTNHYFFKLLKHLALLVCLLSVGITYSQNFSQSTLKFNGRGSVNRVTSLMFGPDGRLYTCEYEGLVKIFTVERAGNSQYNVLAMETLNDIQTIQNHNDDGSLDNTTFRQTTGLTVAGTAANPVIYVTSSDIRVGGGNHGGGGDIGLDTNSGIITRFTWNGSSWDVVDIVRGLPRSEENHAVSGLEFVTVNGTDYLIVTSGGNTNLGSPSYNFTYLPEYALSAAVLSVNLSMIEALPIQTVNNRKFIYDIPTLDDPTRPNVNGITDPDDPGYDGIDVNDPFGGNDGLNQAKLVPGGPVQIFSPGYRNTYDIVVTEKGAVFATDNGANGGWGGLPFNEGLFDTEGNSLATNNYVPGEPGGTSQYSNGEWANNQDHLQWITNDIQNYAFGSYYGGHSNPIRANPLNAGWYTAPERFGNTGAVFRTKIYDPDGSRPGSTTDPNIALPADWPPVPLEYANPVEGDFRGPGLINPDGPVDGPILIWGTNTNGIDEYTASNFNGAMKGDLIAGTNTGELRRVQLNEDNTLKAFNPSFVSGLSGNALGITCNSDFDIFPGTIWIGNFNNTITILEPQDFVVCINPGDPGYDPYADYDNDGYTNQDEIDNMTDPCNAASQPQDFDKSAGGVLISDLNDPDDDNDGIPDALDPFQLGNPDKDGSDAFTVPVVNELFSDTFLGGYRGLGFTGMMNNGDTGANWLNWLDRRDDPNDPNPNDILGGAIGAMTMQMTSGTALGLANNQEKAFQYGVQVDQSTGVFVVTGGIVNFNQPLQLYGNSAAPDGELGFFIGDGTQSNYIKFVARQQGLRVQQEINDIPQPPMDLFIDSNNRPNGSIIFNFIVNPSNGEITFEYVFDNDPPQILGSLFAEGSILTAIQESTLDLAVGLIGTSNAMGVELEGTWGVLNVIPVNENPISVEIIGNLTNTAGDNLNGTFGITANGGDGALIYTAVGLPEGLSINPTTGKISGNISLNASKNSPYNVSIVIDDSDFDNTDVQVINFVWTILDFWDNADYYTVPFVRVNAGGSLITASDNSNVNWMENNTNGAFSNSVYSVTSGTNIVGISGISRHASIPDHIDTNTFNQIFSSERWSNTTMEYAFPVPNASYIVNLYLANSHSSTNDPGERIFNIQIENATVRSGLDLVTEFGHKVGGMLSFLVHVNDGTLNIRFSHGLIQNPLINGIEIRSIMLGSPIVVNEVGNQTNQEGDALDGSLGVLANGGEGNLSYTAIGLPPGIVIEPINGQIGGTIAAGAAANSPYHVTITVDDSDDTSNDAVTINFDWIVTSPANPGGTTSPVMRVNAGGSLVAATDGDVNWLANNAPGSYNGTGYTVSSGNITNVSGMAKHSSIPDHIDNATFNALFANERWSSSASGMAFAFPIANGNYIVNLYMGSYHNSTNDPGERMFNIAIEGNMVRSNLDLVTEFGHRVGAMLSFPVSVTDGTLNILFSKGASDNPLVNAIEIMSVSDEEETPVEVPIVAETPANQSNVEGDIMDGSLQIVASGGDGALSFSATGMPTGVAIDPESGQITGTIAAGAAANSPYHVTITVDDSDDTSDDAVTINFDWIVTSEFNSMWIDKNENENYTSRHENSFVQAGDKFYLMGGRENSRTIDVYDYTSNTWTSLVDSAPFEFNHFQATEYQGLIWVIGAFKSNSYPNEVPAEFVWAFDPTSETWIQGPEIPVSRRRGSAGLVVHNDKFYVVAGNYDGHDGGYVAWFDEFDPATGQWTVLEDAPRARDHFFASVINNKLYAVGGRLSGGPGGTFSPTISEVDVYDFITNTWSTLPVSQNVPTPRGGAATAVLENKLFVIGGEVSNQLINGETTSGALAITEIFDPVQLTWTRGSDLNHKRHGTQAIASGDGIHILGGSPNLGGGNQKNMEYYGVDNPIGIPSIPSILSATSNAIIDANTGGSISLDVSQGNVGIFIKAIEISGTNAQYFEINSGAISEGLIKANSSHIIGINYIGFDDNISADLIIHYGTDSSLTVTLNGITNNSLKMQSGNKNSNVLNENAYNPNSSEISFYPNPASSEVFLTVSNASVTDIYVNDISGRMIKAYKASSLKYGYNQYRLDVSELSNGMYFINLQTTDTMLSTKLIVQK